LPRARCHAQGRQPAQVRRRNGWAIDRRGRSLIDLLGTIEHLQDLDQQYIDTTTPTGKLLFQITGAFAEFELRLEGGQGAQEARSTRCRTRQDRRELAKGLGIVKVAREVGLGVGTVHRLKRETGVQAAG
jgi:DNA invertase Pin-like site-specific DNA recombinase